MAKSQEKTQNLTLAKLPLEPSYQEKVDQQRELALSLSLKQLTEKFETMKKSKVQVETNLEHIQVSLTAIEQLILEKFSENGLTSIKTAQGATLFTRTSVYPRVENKQLMMAWIKKNRAEGMLMVSHTSLRSLCTERLESGEELPEGVECFLKDTLVLKQSK